MYTIHNYYYSGTSPFSVFFGREANYNLHPKVADDMNLIDLERPRPRAYRSCRVQWSAVAMIDLPGTKLALDQDLS